MRKAKDTIKQQIDRIRSAHTNRDLDTGMLYNKRTELRRKMKKITLWGLFVSDENTFLVRPHIFESKDGRDAQEWNAWMQREYGTILRENILDGMENRTGKQWRLYRVIGWSADDNSRVIRAKTRKKRNKTKPKRRQNGRNSTRRR